MNRIASVAHVCIKTADLEATERFYCGALGMEKRFAFMRKGEAIGFYLKTANDTFIEVFKADGVEKLGGQVLNHFCLQTEDIRGLRQSLAEKGFFPGEVRMGADGTWPFWMDDPNGLAVEFQEYTDRSAQFAGGEVEVDW